MVVVNVPEPASLSLLVVGALALISPPAEGLIVSVTVRETRRQAGVCVA